MSRGDRIWEPGGLTLADSFGHIGAILSSSSFPNLQPRATDSARHLSDVVIFVKE